MERCTKIIKSFKSYKRLMWMIESSLNSKDSSGYTEVIFYNQELAEVCCSNKIATIVNTVLKDEFPEIQKDNPYYDLLMYALTKELSTMQSIKNVLLYKKENNIKMIKDVRFKNREVQLTCLI